MSGRYAIIAVTLGGNRGAEAMLETTVGRIRDRDPGATFALYSYMPETDSRLLSDKTITVYSSTPAYLVLALFPASLLLGLFQLLSIGPIAALIVPRSVRDLASCTALVDLAGVAFIDGREKFLPFNLLTIWPAMLLGVPVFKLSQALGPFEHAATHIASRMLWQCRMVVPRGAGTLKHLQDAGFPKGLTFPAPDVAFAFEERDALTSEGAEEVAELRGRIDALRADGVRVMGLCPSAVIATAAVEQGWDYAGFLAQIVEGLIADGVAVLLFPNATRACEPEKMRNNDLPVIAAVADRVCGDGASERLLAVRGDVNAAQIRRLVTGCDAVAVSRFHAMIGALAASIPVVVLGWSHKYAEVMDRFGLGEWVFDYSERDPQAFLGRCRQLLDQRETVASAIGEHLGDVRRESVAQFDEMMRRLEEDA